jgi:hypothetical protein
MKGANPILLSVEQRELRALMNEINEVLPYVNSQQSEAAIRILIPILSTAIKTSQEEIADDLDQLSADELIRVILDRRRGTSFEEAPPKKREKESKKRSIQEEQEVEHKDVILFDNKAYGIIGVDSFGQHNGEDGLFVRVRKRGGNFKPQTAFANAESLKAIDHTQNMVHYKKATAALMHGIQKMQLTPRLTTLLEQSKWGQQLLQTL